MSLPITLLRRARGRVRASFVRRRVLSELRELAASRRPIVAGPWLGEVGFEVIYWVPFLRWACARFAIAPARVTAVSRGGTSSWYLGIADHYADAFDHWSLDEFRRRGTERVQQVGEQKQVRESSADRDLLRAARRAGGGEDAVTLHPRLMFELYRPFWWRHASADWVAAHANYQLLSADTVAAAALPAVCHEQRGRYVALKFYQNDCVDGGEATRRIVREITQALAAHGPVVSLHNAGRVDDHSSDESAPVAGVCEIAALATPRDNLAVQAAVVAQARLFVGSYGGFSYLAPLHGVPAVTFYSRAGGFDRSHLAVARAAAAQLQSPPFHVYSLTEHPRAIIARHLS